MLAYYTGMVTGIKERNRSSAEGDSPGAARGRSLMCRLRRLLAAVCWSRWRSRVRRWSAATSFRRRWRSWRWAADALPPATASTAAAPARPTSPPRSRRTAPSRHGGPPRPLDTHSSSPASTASSSPAAAAAGCRRRRGPASPALAAAGWRQTAGPGHRRRRWRRRTTWTAAAAVELRASTTTSSSHCPSAALPLSASASWLLITTSPNSILRPLVVFLKPCSRPMSRTELTWTSRPS